VFGAFRVADCGAGKICTPDVCENAELSDERSTRLRPLRRAAEHTNCLKTKASGSVQEMPAAAGVRSGRRTRGSCRSAPAAAAAAAATAATTATTAASATATATACRRTTDAGGAANVVAPDTSASQERGSGCEWHCARACAPR
jgi:hypothetical protein